MMFGKSSRAPFRFGGARQGQTSPFRATRGTADFASPMTNLASIINPGGASPGQANGPGVGEVGGFEPGAEPSSNPGSVAGHPTPGMAGFQNAVAQSNVNSMNNPNMGLGVRGLASLATMGIPLPFTLPLSIMGLAGTGIGPAASAGITAAAHAAGLASPSASPSTSPSVSNEAAQANLSMGIPDPTAQAMAQVSDMGGGGPSGAAGAAAGAGAAGAAGGAASAGDGNGDGAAWRRGGWVRGDGDGRLEPVQGTVHEGEFVLRPEAAAAIGGKRLNELNRKGNAKMLAQALASRV